MIIRKTTEKDIPEIDNIYAEAKRFMRESGNPNQWQSLYPNGDSARADIEKGIGYVGEENGEIVAVFAFGDDGEPTYDKIYDDAWLNEEKYAYIHRITVKYKGRGHVAECFDYCFSVTPNLKIDTHKDNIPMQKALARAGFVKCGIIYLENGEERIAFQKTN